MDRPFLFWQDSIFTDTNRFQSVIPYDIAATEPLLRDGIPLASNPFSADWITLVIIAEVLLYAVVATFSRQIFAEMILLLTRGGAGKPEDDFHGLFRWQSTLANLASFMNLSLLFYFALLHAGVDLPFVSPGPGQWFILLAALSLLMALRHLVSAATGYISETQGLFSEYLNNIYIIYRITGLAILPLLTAIAFMPEIPAKAVIAAGAVALVLLLIFRIFRLLAIFIQHGVSIFYFLLYLCALEILPAAMLFKLLSA